MFSFHEILTQVLLPCGLSLAVLLLGQLVFRRRIDPFNRWVPPSALALGVAVGEGFVCDWPRLPPASNSDWLAFAGMAAVPAALVLALLQRWFVARVVIAAAGLGALLWLLDRGHASSWTPLDGWAIFGKACGLAFCFWLLLDGLTGCSTGPGLPLVLTLSAAAVAVFMMTSGSQKLAMASAALAAAAGPLFLVGCWSRLFSVGRAGVLIFALLYCGLLAEARFTMDAIPLQRLLILLAAPLLAWVDQFPGINRLSNTWRVALQVVLVGAALAYAVGPAALAAKQAAGEG